MRTRDPRTIVGVVIAGVVAVACGGTRARPVEAAKPARSGDVCRGYDADACQERVLLQSLCLVAQEEDAGCEALRAEGFLPPSPPPLDGLLRCWQVEEPRDDRPWVWICVGARDVAIDGAWGWDVWPHGGWRREDTVRRAGWTAERVGGGSLWLTPIDGGLHLSDGDGLAARLIAGEPASAGEVTAARAQVPAPSVVCEAARACLRAMPPPPRVTELDEGEGGPAPPDPLAGRQTLRACEAAWHDAAARLDEAVARAAIPGACAIAPAREPDAWSDPPLVPPFARP